MSAHSFIKFIKQVWENKTRSQTIYFFYHMTLKYFEISFLPYKVIILSLCTQRCYGRHNVSRKSVNH